MRDLDLAGTQITDRGLEHLKDLVELERLTLDNTRITDRGLEHLKRLTKVVSVRLISTNVAGPGLEHLEGMRNLQSSIPWAYSYRRRGASTPQKVIES